MKIIPLKDEYRIAVNALIEKAWAGPFVVTRGKLIDTTKIHTIIAIENKKLLGVLTYNISDEECEIVSFNSLCDNRGIGSLLIKTIIDVAKTKDCKRIWLITTNDNTKAIRYYQKRGFDLVAVHLNALNESRLLKPSIPLDGIDNIPLMHEFEFEIRIKK